MKPLSLYSLYAAEESVSLPLPVSKAPESLALTAGGGGGERICCYVSYTYNSHTVTYTHLSCRFILKRTRFSSTVHNHNAILQQPPTAQRPLPRVGLSSEWGGSSRPMSLLLDEGMTRSKVTSGHEPRVQGLCAKKKRKEKQFQFFSAT